MKKTNKPAAAPCGATATGQLVCVLERNHAGVHSTSTQRKAPQHATWGLADDGRIRVITYSHGKKMSEWFEDPPVAPPQPRDEKCIASRNAVWHEPARCRLAAGHAGNHEAEVIVADGWPETGEVRVIGWDKHGKGTKNDTLSRPATRPMTLEDEPEDAEADAAAIVAMDADAAARANLEPEDDDDDPLEDEIRSDEERAFAREQREAREAHARDLELAEGTAGALAEAAKDNAIIDRAVRKVSKIYTKAERERMEAETAVAPAPDAPLTKIGDYQIHPAAALFPMISEAEWPAFRDDINTNGQRRRIVRLGGSILDGRNRLRACLELGLEPAFRDFGDEPTDGADPIAFVVSENVNRRHLTETDRAWVGVELVPMYEAQAKERMRSGRRDPSPNSGEGATGKATELAARAVNVGKTSIEAALKVKREAAPEVVAASRERGLKVSAAAELATLPKKEQRAIVEKVGKGEIRAGKVRALVKQEKKRAVVRKINEQRVAPVPMGPFGVIYADYPWLFDNSDQHNGSRGHLPYPPMAMDAIVAHARQVAARAAKDCVVALWVTNAHILELGRVLEAFGATHRTVVTWPKPKAGVGTWPRGQTEHLIIASIGEPTHTLNEITTLLPSFEPEHPGEHSSKPAEVAELLRRHCPGPHLELFGRGPREGWVVWGAEADKFASEAA